MRTAKMLMASMTWRGFTSRLQLCEVDRRRMSSGRSSAEQPRVDYPPCLHPACCFIITRLVHCRRDQYVCGGAVPVVRRSSPAALFHVTITIIVLEERGILFIVGEPELGQGFFATPPSICAASWPIITS